MNNNNAYITEANFGKITSGNKLKIGNDELYRYKGNILTFIKNWDLITLNKHSIFIKNMSEGETGFYTRIEKDKDTYSKIYEGGTPAYHLYNDCSRLNSDFENYEIPDLIFNNISEEYQNGILNQNEYLNSKKNIAEKYRIWFKKNGTNIEKFQKDWNIKMKGGFKKIKYDNSGIKEFENMTILDIETIIDKKIEEHSLYLDNLSEKERFFIKSLGKYTYFFKDIKEEGDEILFWEIVEKKHKVGINKNTFNKYQYKKLLLLLREYDKNFLLTIKNMLKKYINITYNKDLNFNINLLESLGFHICAECQKTKNII